MAEQPHITLDNINAKDLWFKLYNDIQEHPHRHWSSVQVNLYYLMEAMVFIRNEGGTRFLEQLRPESRGENRFEPFCRALYFFSFNDLAEWLEQYNDFCNQLYDLPDPSANRKLEQVVKQLGNALETLPNEKAGVEQWITSNKFAAGANLL